MRVTSPTVAVAGPQAGSKPSRLSATLVVVGFVAVGGASGKTAAQAGPSTARRGGPASNAVDGRGGAVDMASEQTAAEETTTAFPWTAMVPFATAPSTRVELSLTAEAIDMEDVVGQVGQGRLSASWAAMPWAEVGATVAVEASRLRLEGRDIETRDLGVAPVGCWLGVGAVEGAEGASWGLWAFGELPPRAALASAAEVDGGGVAAAGLRSRIAFREGAVAVALGGEVAALWDQATAVTGGLSLHFGFPLSRLLAIWTGLETRFTQALRPAVRGAGAVWLLATDALHLGAHLLLPVGTDPAGRSVGLGLSLLLRP